MEISAVHELGEQLHSLVAEFDPEVCDGDLAKRYVEVFARLERLAGAGKTLALGQVDRTRAWAHGASTARSTADWLAEQTGAPVGDAIRATNTARGLRELSGTESALRQGRLSAHQAHEIAEAAIDAPQAEAALLDVAATDSFQRLRDRARAAKASANDDRERVERQRALRSARRWTDAHGMRRYGLALTPEQAATFEPTWDHFCSRAFAGARREGKRESHEAYATDALVEMALVARAGEVGPRESQRNGSSRRNGAATTHALVVIDAAALKRGHTVAGETCAVAGIGPIDVTAAKRLLGDAVIDIVIKDGVDVRTVAHAGRSANRRQKAALLVGWECEIRGCSSNRNLEIDHIVPFADSGRTAIEHLGPKCRWHHHLKTHKAWRDGPRGPDGKRDLVPPGDPSRADPPGLPGDLGASDPPEPGIELGGDSC